MSAAGRKASHFKSTAGDTLLGWIHQRDGRWRILAIGRRFVANSEAEWRIEFENKGSLQVLIHGDLKA